MDIRWTWDLVIKQEKDHTDIKGLGKKLRLYSYWNEKSQSVYNMKMLSREQFVR